MTQEPAAALERSVGIITADPTPTLLALLAHATIDFLVLDAEQTGITVQQCSDVVQRLAGSGVKVAVRVPDLDRNTLVAFANTGVAEIVLPQVRTVDELERAYEATRYAPAGSRPRQVTPASAFGMDYSFAPVITVLFETAEAVERVKEFVGSEAFGGGWVGPTDLAADLLRHGDERPEALQEAVQRVVDVVAGASRSIGLPAPGMAAAAGVFERGADRCAVYWEKELASMLTGYTELRAA
ncbi:MULTISPECIES: aldolase/citrate lyase family protein [unclassified Arthrobacter]|uniref:aldolase/citrate lyase family protein n=1 Tax=unclassified Pseudarthrobacter TaxID=2647000 RepID=UPI003399CEF8